MSTRQRKTCNKCAVEKPLSQFYKGKGCKDGHRGDCKECTKKASTKYVQDNFNEVARYKKAWYDSRASTVVDKNRFAQLGVTAEEYAARGEAQKGLCAICGKVCSTGRRLAQDHCHVTGKIRDLLCHSCNTSLGGFKDSIEVLQKAIDYLRKHE